MSIDFGMNAQEAVDAGRFHHQWLPDRINYEKFAFSPDTGRAAQGQGPRDCAKEIPRASPK